MDSQQIIAFCELASCLSYTEAAARLFLSQSTLSRSIAALEDEIGCKLFFRNNRTVSLTPGGKYLHEYFIKNQEQNSDAIRKAKRMNEGKRGFISIGSIGVESLNGEISAKLSSFLEEHPSIDIMFRESTVSGLRNILISSSIDAVITRVIHVEGLTNVDYVPLSSCSGTMVVRREHPALEGRDSLTPEDLTEYPLAAISVAVSSGRYQQLVGTFNDYGLKPEVSVWLNSVQELLMYISVTNSYGFIDEDESMFPTSLVNFPTKSKKRIVTVLAYNRSNTNPALLKLIHHLRETAGEVKTAAD